MVKVLYIVHMSVLVDANIYLAVILDEPEKKRIVELTQNTELVSPLAYPMRLAMLFLLCLSVIGLQQYRFTIVYYMTRFLFAL
jgi:hypothetical protein